MDSEIMAAILTIANAETETATESACMLIDAIAFTAGKDPAKLAREIVGRIEQATKTGGTFEGMEART
jgi:hypothetical protein